RHGEHWRIEQRAPGEDLRHPEHRHGAPRAGEEVAWGEAFHGAANGEKAVIASEAKQSPPRGDCFGVLRTPRNNGNSLFAPQPRFTIAVASAKRGWANGPAAAIAGGRRSRAHGA